MQEWGKVSGGIRKVFASMFSTFSFFFFFFSNFIEHVFYIYIYIQVIMFNCVTLFTSPFKKPLLREIQQKEKILFYFYKI